MALSRQMQENLAALRIRTLRTMKQAHWWQKAPEMIVCLDFSLKAPTPEELKDKMVAAMDAIDPDAVLHSAPTILWLQFMAAPLQQIALTIPTDHGRGQISVVI